MAALTTISSSRNPLVRHAIRLRDNRFRQKQRQVIVDGIREIERALAGGWRLQQLLVAEVAHFDHSPSGRVEPQRGEGDRWWQQRQQLIQTAGPLAVWLTPELLAQVAYGQNPREAVAIFQQPDDLGLQRLDSVLGLQRESKSRQAPLIVVLAGIEKPGNAGAIFRSADAMAADAVVLCSRWCDLGNPNLIRSSLGTAFTVPCAQASETETIAWLQQHQFQSVAAIVDAPQTFWQVDLRLPTALIVGSEADGLGDEWLQLAQSGKITPVGIPMLGVADSLNVSVAAAALLFEARRQRGC